jgi:C-terminal processing protease CtpA/Prc
MGGMWARRRSIGLILALTTSPSWAQTPPQDGRFRIEDRYATKPPDGSRFDAPVFILTSRATAKAAEELDYDRQTLRHATVVGETTAGLANPYGVFPAAPGFSIVLPTGFVEGAATHGNWEGAGVKPDVATPACEALAMAYELALKDLKPGNPRDRAAIDAALRSSVQF